ncbi:MAG: TIGR01777 family protein [Desulfobulbaceae bacterium]|nr:TIGR01777 family protein [Desulfobulbaceae bacterium]
MKIFITGGTGFVGRAVAKHLSAIGHQITILGRTATSSGQEENPRFLQGDPVHPGSWQEELRDHEAVINLAGASIFCRWNQANRREIRDSRVLSSRNIVNALRLPGCRVRVLLNGSAVGYYGERGDEELDENSSNGRGFLAEVCQAWEAEATQAEGLGIRVVRCRLGVILGKNGGALGKMVPLFRAGFGARLGSGRQWFPWIHQADLGWIFAMLLENQDISGAINCVAPEATTNGALTNTLAKVLRHPLLLPPIPAFFLRLGQGEASALLLDSLRVAPRRLEQIGFNYKFPTLASALADLLHSGE